MSDSLSALQAQLFSAPDANVFAVLDGVSRPELLAQLAQYQPKLVDIGGSYRRIWRWRGRI